MLLSLEISSETIGSEHLKRAEEHEQTQAVDEVSLIRNLGIVLQRVVILIDQLTAQLVRIFCRSLPKERCEVVVERTATASLEVDEIRISVLVKHDVASLEVAIEETTGRRLRHVAILIAVNEVVGKATESSLKFQLMEVESCGFQEAILEVVEVEENTVNVHLRLWIAL